MPFCAIFSVKIDRRGFTAYSPPTNTTRVFGVDSCDGHSNLAGRPSKVYLMNLKSPANKSVLEACCLNFLLLLQIRDVVRFFA